MASRQCILAMELEDIKREKFDGSIAKCQIRQYFPPSINCTIWYVVKKLVLKISKLYLKINTRGDIAKPQKNYFYAHLLNEYAKEEEKNKTTDWPTFHRVLLRKSGEYLFSISLTYQVVLVTCVVFIR